jgi:serine/threonine protein kinase
MRLLSDKTGFGKVYEAYAGTTPKIIKVLKEELNDNTKAVELFQQEAAVLGQLNHPGLPEEDGYFPFQTNNGPLLHCIAMEKIEGPNLEGWLQQQGNRPISGEQAIAWLTQLAVILHLVHGKNYLHRDIKPSNIMIRPDGQLVLIDFGTAREVTRTYLAKLGAGKGITAIVSSGYTAPEQMHGHAVPQSDFFSLGRTFVYLLTGHHPLDLYDAHNDVLEWRSYANHASSALLNIIDWLMMREVSKRPANAEEILQRLAAINGQKNEKTAATVNVVGSPLPPIPSNTTSYETMNMGGSSNYEPPPQTETSSPEDNQRFNIPYLAWLAVLLVLSGLIILTAIALSKSGINLIPTATQAPQRKGKIDYFPYVEGRDSQGRTAEFSVAVLSVEYKWFFGSNYQVQSGGQKINLEALKSNLEQEGIQRIMDNPNEIISVGTASCEGALATEERRAFSRAQQIQLLVKKLFSNVRSVQGYRLLNLGQFTRRDCQPNQDLTSYQRSVIIIGVKKKSEGVILDEALRDRLETKPFADFKLEDYSLGSPEKFKTIPSNL